MVPGTENQFLLIAYGLGWSEVTPQNLLKCRVNEDGSCEVIAGEGFAGMSQAVSVGNKHQQSWHNHICHTM